MDHMKKHLKKHEKTISCPSVPLVGAIFQEPHFASYLDAHRKARFGVWSHTIPIDSSLIAL